MADKKITELTELATMAQEDLLVVVDNPTGTPITKKMQLSSLLNTLNFTTSVTANAHILVKSVLSVAANTTGAGVLAAGKFSTNANAFAQNIPFQYGLIAESKLNGAAANVVAEHAAAKFTLDVGAAGVAITNTYGIIVKMANTGTRVANTQAFISFAEDQTGITAQTLYLFDVGQNGMANVTANISGGGEANTFYLLTNSVATTTHKLKIRVNGVDMWILVSNTAA